MLTPVKFATFLGLFAVIGCSSQHPADPQLVASNKSANFAGAQPSEGEYTVTGSSGAFGSMELHSITNSYFARRQSEINQSRIVPLSLQTDFGLDAYAFEGYQAPRAVFIVPKVVFRSSLVGNRGDSAVTSADTVDVRLSFEIVDATRDFDAAKRARLISKLKEGLRGEPTFLSNVQCPDHIIIQDGDVASYNVGISSKLKSCLEGMSIPATIRFKKSEYQQFRAGFVDHRHVIVKSYFNFSTPVITQYAALNLNVGAVRGLLQGQMDPTVGALTREQVLVMVTKAASTINTSLGGGLSENLLQDLSVQLRGAYFTADTSSNCSNVVLGCFYLSASATGGGGGQLFLTDTERFGSDVPYISSSVLSDSQAIRSKLLLATAAASLTVPTDPAVNNSLQTFSESDIVEFTFRTYKQTQPEYSTPQIQNIIQKICTAPFSQCQSGSWSCTNPAAMESYDCKDGCPGGYQQVPTGCHSVCVEEDDCHGDHGAGGGHGRGLFSYGVCPCVRSETRCDSAEMQCPSWGPICSQRPICDRLVSPATPVLPYRIDATTITDPNFTWACTNQTDAACAESDYKEIWQRITTFSTPYIPPGVIERKMTGPDITTVLGGLKFQFSNGVTCDPSDFNPKVVFDPAYTDPPRVVFTFANSDGCHPFGLGGPGERLGMLVQNQITMPVKYQCGDLWENDQGQRRYTCLMANGRMGVMNTNVTNDLHRDAIGERRGFWRTLYPRVEIETELRFVGEYFDSLPREIK